MMKSPIRVHFYRAKNGIPNFGDELSALTVEYVTSRRVQHAGYWNCDLLGIGSILDRCLRTKGRIATGVRKHVLRNAIAVWGSGILQHPVSTHHNLRILAVRGISTRLALNAPPSVPLGDPGLLVARMFGPSNKTHRLGIVPHYTDKQHPMVTELAKLPNTMIIDVEDDAAAVTKRIASCEVVLSSSLHGLIVADSFQIPNYRLRLGDRLKGGDFRFLDYASALGRPQISGIVLSNPSQALDLIENQADFTYQSEVDSLCNALETALRNGF